jgi:glycosyltransferase involved in cell wall biosynthesis
MVEAIAEVTIGLPVYNGAAFIRQAIDSLLRQRFTRWKLVVSDNASSDNTSEIVREYAARDPRIQLTIQSANKGAVENFRTVAKTVHSPYFMWMAADDVLEPEFISSCVARLNATSCLGMAFCAIRNIDSFGREIRSYSKLHRFSGRASFFTIFKYLVSPEAMGKANLIYSVYRTKVVMHALRHFPFGDEWGSDMAFVLGAISIAGIDVTPAVLFNKRWVRTTDSMDQANPIPILQGIYHNSCPIDFYPEYMDAMLRSVKGTRFWLLAWVVMNFRYLQLTRIHQTRLKLAQPKPPKPPELPWMARMNKALRILGLK